MKTINENYFINSKKFLEEPTKIDDILNSDEQILWRGKPNRKAYIFGSIFSMMPIALLWLLVDCGIIVAMIATGAFSNMNIGLILGLVAFFAVHLMPVWIWFGNIISATRSYKNLEYAFTNKRIIIKSGFIGIDFKNIYYSEIHSVNLKVGPIDKILKVGDIYIRSNNKSQVLFDIPDPYFITQKLQEIVIDIKTDIEFPNKLRPDTNPGYITKYEKNSNPQEQNNNSPK